MVDGGLGTASRRQQRLERALSASTLLPTFAFAALGTLTVILVALMGMSQLGVGPSARDLGLSVTTPQMSVSIAPPPARPSAIANERETRRDGTPSILTAAVEAPERGDLVMAVGFAVQRSSQATSAVDPEPASKPASKPAIVPGDPPRGAQPAVEPTGGAQAFGQGRAFGQGQAFGLGQGFDQGQALSQEQTISQRQAFAADDGAALDDGAARVEQRAKQTTATKALKQTTVARALKQTKTTKAFKQTKTTKASGQVKAARVHV